MEIHLRPAAETDLKAIVPLMNAAFRGAPSEKSWSVETSYIAGNRTDEALLREEIAEGAKYLIAEDAETLILQGCVSLKILSAERWYLGSLTVDPSLQNAGFGRKLLRSAEEYGKKHGARAMEITVVNVRSALISWYERRGYRLTGGRRSFPYGDNRFGVPLRNDLEFVVLEKLLHE